MDDIKEISDIITKLERYRFMALRSNNNLVLLEAATKRLSAFTFRARSYRDWRYENPHV